jgi:hypothetical protein
VQEAEARHDELRLELLAKEDELVATAKTLRRRTAKLETTQAAVATAKCDVLQVRVLAAPARGAAKRNATLRWGVLASAWTRLTPARQTHTRTPARSCATQRPRQTGC